MRDGLSQSNFTLAQLPTNLLQKSAMFLFTNRGFGFVSVATCGGCMTIRVTSTARHRVCTRAQAQAAYSSNRL